MDSNYWLNSNHGTVSTLRVCRKRMFSRWKGQFCVFLLNINRKFKLNHKLSRTGIIKHILHYFVTKFVAREVYCKVVFLRQLFQKSGQYIGITNNNVTTGN